MLNEGKEIRKRDFALCNPPGKDALESGNLIINTINAVDQAYENEKYRFFDPSEIIYPFWQCSKNGAQYDRAWDCTVLELDQMELDARKALREK